MSITRRTPTVMVANIGKTITKFKIEPDLRAGPIVYV